MDGLKQIGLACITETCESEFNRKQLMNSYIQIAGGCDGPYPSGKIAQMQAQGQLPPQTVWTPEGSTLTTYRPDLVIFAPKCQNWPFQEWILNPC